MRKLTWIIALVTLLTLVGAGNAFADDPPGNNGTVKIEGEPPDNISDPPDNNPHQGCVFSIEWRGFDEGDLNSTWDVASHPPSGSGESIVSGSVFIGEDAAGGAPDLDAVVVINLAESDLSAFFEHPQQGFHVKLSVHAEGSIGADTKFKVFWVLGCPPYPITEPTGEQIAPAAAAGTLPEQPSAAGPLMLLGVSLAACMAMTFVARRSIKARLNR